MEAFGYYLFKSAIWLSGFAVVYLLFLRNERFFILKRIYLISGILVSFIFPLITFHYSIEMPAPVSVFNNVPGVSAESGAIRSVITESGKFSYNYLFAGIYLAGILFLAVRTGSHFSRMFRAVRRAEIQTNGQARIIRTSEYPSSFSFFNYVFVGSSLSGNEVEEIMNHEMVHINQKHWLDLLLGETVRLLQWANPFAWIYTSLIRLNHEYLADEVALRNTSNPAVYKAILLNQIFKAPVISLTNSFNYSLNKTRFDMMKKVIVSPYRKLKVLFVLPVFAFLFYAFAKPEYHYTSVNDNINQYTETLSPTDLSLKKDEVRKEDEAQMQDTNKLRNANGTEANPLIVIDGKETERKNLNGIEPNLIENVTVLKGVSATKRYGDKAKDGVIIVTTKNQPQKQVKGIVADMEGKPLQGVNITSTGTTGYAMGATTDVSGRFSFSNVQDDAILLFYLPGYKRISLKADFTKEMTVKMEKDPDYKAPEGPAQPQFQMPPRVVTVDGVLTDKTAEEVRKGLGYNYGIMNIGRGKASGDKPAVDTIKIITRKKALEMGLKPPFPRLAPEDYPTFQGQRYSAFQDWIKSQLKYPADAMSQKIEGWVSLNFKVQLDGTLSDFQSTIPVNPILSDAVTGLIKSSPKWDPPKNTDVDEVFSQTVTVNFKLPGQVIFEAPYVVVEQMPRYPGGDAELLKFIADNTIYPEAAKEQKISGRVILRFVVSKEGKTEAISVLKGVHPLLDAEAIRVVSSIAGWEPGKQGGVPVNVWYMVPVTFALNTPGTTEPPK